MGAVTQNWLILQKFSKNQNYRVSKSKIIKWHWFLVLKAGKAAKRPQTYYTGWTVKKLNWIIFKRLFSAVFVEGEFEEGDVVCTTWTWVYIGATCIIFLVFSILVVCVLCIYTNRRSSDARYKHEPTYAGSQRSVLTAARPTTPGTLYQSQLGGYSTPYGSTRPDHTLKSLRTSLRDWTYMNKLWWYFEWHQLLYIAFP